MQQHVKQQHETQQHEKQQPRTQQRGRQRDKKWLQKQLPQQQQLVVVAAVKQAQAALQQMQLQRRRGLQQQQQQLQAASSSQTAVTSPQVGSCKGVVMQWVGARLLGSRKMADTHMGLKEQRAPTAAWRGSMDVAAGAPLPCSIYRMTSDLKCCFCALPLLLQGRTGSTHTTRQRG